MLKNLLYRLKTVHNRAVPAQKGQSIIIIAFAFLGLIAMLGLALDLGLVYIEQVRISRTTDAAALASVVELPFEEEAIRRAIEYIELNGYSQEDTEIRVRGCIDVSGDFSNVDTGTPLPGSVLADGDTVPINPAEMLQGYVYQPALQDPPRNVFVIDTLAYQPVDFDAVGNVTTTNDEMCGGGGGGTPDLYGTANKLRVRGRSQVGMNFMQFFGFRQVPVEDEALGENVTSLDVVVVFDVSGSMDFETTCFGCWEKDGGKDAVDYPWPSNGTFNPLNYVPADGTYSPDNTDIFWKPSGGSVVSDNAVCSTAPTSAVYSGENYLIHEAEFYSRDVPLHGWEFDKRTPGDGFWVLQRVNRGSNNAFIRTHTLSVYSQSSLSNFPQLQGASYNAECFKNQGGVGSLSGQCWANRAASLGESAPSDVPWVEYDFTPDWTGDAHIWLRAVGGYRYGYEWYGSSPPALNDWQKSVYWQVDNGEIKGGPFNGLREGGWSSVSDNDWRWIKLGSEPVTSGVQKTFKLYQGSASFNADKIIFTSNSAGSVGTAVKPNGDGIGDTGLKNVLKDNSGEGPDATPGSATREACNKCNPMYGQTVDSSQCSCMTGPTDSGTGVYPAGGSGQGCTLVLTTTNQLTNDLFHDVDPLRSAKQAVKNFVARLDPKFDQVGFVPFSSNPQTPREKLQCLRYASSRYGDQAYCYSQDEPGETRPISYTRIIRAVEEREPGGSTNIAGGMREALEELGVDVPGYINVDSSCASYTGGYSSNGDNKACDRRGAARRVIILLTDGSPNQSVSCGSFNWQGNFGAGKNSYNCAMYYSQQAADNNVVVYTIGIGSGVNRDLLTAMATGEDPGTGDVYFSSRGGRYYPAARPSDLDGIFQDILSNIFVRIIG